MSMGKTARAARTLATEESCPLMRRPSLRVPCFAVCLLVAGGTALAAVPAAAAQAPVPLGTTAQFAVLAGSTVTNTGASTVSGNLGLSPGTSVTGFPPGKVVNGTQHRTDTVAATAQADARRAYDSAARRTPTQKGLADLGGRLLPPGVYAGPALSLTGTVTLDARNDPNAVFVFQAGSTLITSSGSVVAFVRGANPCNVFWKVGSSATLGTGSVFRGTVDALTSITVDTGASVTGRLLARNAAVTLHANSVTLPVCSKVVAPRPTATASPSVTPKPTSVAPVKPTPGSTGSPRATPSPSATSTPRATSSTAGGSTAAPRRTTAGPAVSAGAAVVLPRTGARTASTATLGLLAIGAGLLLLATSRPRRGVHRRRSTDGS